MKDNKTTEKTMKAGDVISFVVRKLAERCNPFELTVWNGLKSPITSEEIQDAICSNRLLDRVHNERVWSREFHVERIAWFVVNGWDDPVEVDVGVPEIGCCPSWLIVDGNHRFAAAIFGEAERIDVIADGSKSEIHLFT